jgi:hypothetical protein
VKPPEAQGQERGNRPRVPGNFSIQGPWTKYGAHGAFDAADSIGGRPGPHWGVSARAGSSLPHPKLGVEWHRDGQIRGKEPVSTPTPTASGMHLKNTGDGGGCAARGASMYEHVPILLDGSDLAEAMPLRRQGAWFSPGATELNGRDGEAPC